MSMERKLKNKNTRACHFLSADYYGMFCLEFDSVCLGCGQGRKQRYLKIRPSCDWPVSWTLGYLNEGQKIP